MCAAVAKVLRVHTVRRGTASVRGERAFPLHIHVSSEYAAAMDGGGLRSGIPTLPPFVSYFLLALGAMMLARGLGIIGPRPVLAIIAPQPPRAAPLQPSSPDHQKEAECATGATGEPGPRRATHFPAAGTL